MLRVWIHLVGDVQGGHNRTTKNCGTQIWHTIPVCPRDRFSPIPLPSVLHPTGVQKDKVNCNTKENRCLGLAISVPSSSLRDFSESGSE